MNQPRDLTLELWARMTRMSERDNYLAGSDVEATSDFGYRTARDLWEREQADPLYLRSADAQEAYVRNLASYLDAVERSPYSTEHMIRQARAELATERSVLLKLREREEGPSGFLSARPKHRLVRENGDVFVTFSSGVNAWRYYVRVMRKGEGPRGVRFQELTNQGWVDV